MSVTISQLQKWLEEYQERITRMLGLNPADVHPITVSQKDVDDENWAWGQTLGDKGHVWISRDMLKTATEEQARGTIIHEAVHAMVHTGGETNKEGARWVEPLADAIRYQMVGNMGNWAPIGEELARLIELAPWQLKAVVGAMEEGSYNNGFLRAVESGQITRKDVDRAPTTPEEKAAWDNGGDQYVGHGGSSYWSAMQQNAKNKDKGEGGGEGGDGGPGGPTNPFAGLLGEEEPMSFQDYLYSAQSAGLPLSAEVRALAHKAEGHEWSTNEFNLALSKTDTYQHDASIGYKSIMQQWGIDGGGNIATLVNEAVNSGYTGEEFMHFLRQTPEYRERFRGIFRNDGTQRMSEEEYMGFEFNLENLGKQYGYNINSRDVGQALRKGILPEQYEDRLAALQRMNEYAPAMKAFQQTLKARGLLPKGAKDWTKREEFNYVTGQSNPKFYQVWEEASAATAAHQAGLDVVYGKKNASDWTDVRRKQLMGIIKGMPGYQSEEQLAEGFEQLGTNLLEVLPLSEARQYGLTKKDLIQATFGGKDAAKARQAVKHVLDTAAAFDEDRAKNSMYQDNAGRNIVQGVSDPRRQQDSEA